MKRYLILISLFALFIAGCKKEEEEILPQNPILSPSSVLIAEKQTTEVIISGGRSPYMVTISPEGLATVAVSGSKLTVTGVKTGTATATVKGSDGGLASLPITVTAKPDPLAEFKADATLRWEFPNGEVIQGDSTALVFITDAGKLFSSSQHKWGYASPDGMTFRLIEWGTSPLVRTEGGTASVTDFQLVKEEEGIVWMMFKLNGTEHRVVGETN